MSALDEDTPRDADERRGRQRPEQGEPTSDDAAPEPTAAIEGRGGGKSGSLDPSAAKVPAAGPHAGPEQVNDLATPGAGTITPAGPKNDVDASSG